MTTEENKALVQRFYAEIDAGNIEAMDELVAEGYVDHNPPPFPGLSEGREGLKEAFRIFWETAEGGSALDPKVVAQLVGERAATTRSRSSPRASARCWS